MKVPLDIYFLLDRTWDTQHPQLEILSKKVLLRLEKIDLIQSGFNPRTYRISGTAHYPEPTEADKLPTIQLPTSELNEPQEDVPAEEVSMQMKYILTN